MLTTELDLAVQGLFDLWNKTAEATKTFNSGLIPAKFLTHKRMVKARRRLQEHAPNDWLVIIAKCGESAFLRGDGPRNKWRASFDWLIENEDNVVKILEGKYDDHRSKAAGPGYSPTKAAII